MHTYFVYTQMYVHVCMEVHACVYGDQGSTSGVVSQVHPPCFQTGLSLGPGTQ